MKKNFYIYAPQVHQGGGKVLLEAILSERIENISCNAIVDEKFEISKGFCFVNWNIQAIKSSFIYRVTSEKKLAINLQSNDQVLFFSNLPPMFKNKAFTTLFLQNKYIIDKYSLEGFSLKAKIRISIQRLWFRIFLKNADGLVVQTESMASIFRNNFNNSLPLSVIPVSSLLNMSNKKSKIKPNPQTKRFIYVASGEPHKNHNNLIAAWKILASDGVTPELNLTLDGANFKNIHTLIEKTVREHNLSIINHGVLSHEEILSLYSEMDALVYPSMLESFGLPLVEAAQYSLPIIASELDYVRDVSNPIETFDPKSSISIARAVKRFLLREEPIKKIRSPNQFLKEIIK